METITTDGLSKRFKIRTNTPRLMRNTYTEVCAVRDISFCVTAQEAVAFIGPSGAGKSTTIKMLTGILHPSSGHVSVLGKVPWQRRQAFAYEIGTVFGQKSQLWYHLPAEDTFNLLRHIYEIPQNACTGSARSNSWRYSRSVSCCECRCASFRSEKGCAVRLPLRCCTRPDYFCSTSRL